MTNKYKPLIKSGPPMLDKTSAYQQQIDKEKVQVICLALSHAAQQLTKQMKVRWE
jgi:hypothetical protein